MIKPVADDVIEFLEQSNFIEGVIDGLDDSVKAWQYIIKKKELTKEIILHTHKILMRKQPLEKEFIGAWRKPFGKWTGEVNVGRKTKAKWYAIPPLMAQWIVNVNDLVMNGKNEYGEFLESSIKNHHIIFEEIHPFMDGNGRVGRILLNWERIKFKLPILVIREEKKFEYYAWFK